MNAHTSLARLALVFTVAAALFGLALPGPASAHPLGNFTINRYNGLTLSPTWAHLDRVVDMAELPTVQARQQMDGDKDRIVSNSEAAAWAEQTCVSATNQLSLTVAGRQAAFATSDAGLSFANGQAGLQTLRLVCSYSAAHAAPAGTASVAFADNTYRDRQGWREIVVRGAAASITGAESAATSSQRLLSYPTGPGASVLAQSSVEFTITPLPGTEPGPLPDVSDAVPIGSPAELIVGGPVAVAGAALPGSIELPRELTSLIQVEDMTLPAIAIALLVAAFVGALHAATPGHGKTLMAAYLVGSRGTVRHAMALGLTVTIAHTVGVLALGALVLAAGVALPAERLFPVLGLVAGVTVTGLGVTFLYQRVSAARRTRRDHEHDHAHHNDHEHAPDHRGAHSRAAEDVAAGWHAHGPLRHTHLPAEDGPLRRRNLVALGLVGGLVPSASAILILVSSIAAGRPAFGMLLTVAFGAGMAAVLVGVGVLLVRARSLVERLPSRNLGRVFAYAPLITALTFVIVGAAITVQAGSQLQ